MLNSNIWVLIAGILTVVLSWVAHTFPQYATLVQVVTPVVALIVSQLSHGAGHVMGMLAANKSDSK